MQLQKCRTCRERHRVGPCPSYGKSSLGGGESRPTKIASGNDRNRVKPLAGLVTEGNPIEPRVAGVASSPSDKVKKKYSKQETCSPVVLVEAMSARDKPTLGQLMIAGVQEAIDMVRSEKKKRAPAGTFDRKVYQREYMRKRRARHQPSGVV